MAKIETHVEDCERLLGKGCLHIHIWLDEYAKEYPPWCYLEYHRKFRHTKECLDEKFKEWDRVLRKYQSVLDELQNRL